MQKTISKLKSKRKFAASDNFTVQYRYRTGSCFLGEGEAVLEPVDDERGGAPRRPRRRAEQERVQQRVSGPQLAGPGAMVTALSANMPLLQHTNLTLIMTYCHATLGDGKIVLGAILK